MVPTYQPNSSTQETTESKIKIPDGEQLALSGIQLLDHPDYTEACKNLDSQYRKFNGSKDPQIAQHLDLSQSGDTSLFDIGVNLGFEAGIA